MKLRLSIFPKILIAMLFVALVPLCAIWYSNYSDANERISNSIDHQLTDVSNKLVQFTDYWVTIHYHMLKQHAATPAIRSMDPKQQNPVLRSIIQELDWIYGVITLAPDGMNVGRYDDKKPEDYSDRIYYKQVIGGAPMGMQVGIGKSTGKPNFTMAVPILKPEDKSVLGLIVFGMNINQVSDIVTQVRVGKTGYAFLLDDTGKVIAHQKEEFSKVADFSQHPAFVNRPTTGIKRLTYKDNGKEVIAYAQATKYGWTMVVQQDYDEAFAPVNSANRKALLLLGITLVLVTFIAYVVAQRLANPIRKLTRIADEMSRGRTVVKIDETQRGDEIGALASAIDRMGTGIRLAIERLNANRPQTASPTEPQRRVGS